MTNACWILDYWDICRSSTRNNPRTANGYKGWNLQFYENPSTTSFEMILVLATFPFLLYISPLSYTSPTIKVEWTLILSNVINIGKIYYSKVYPKYVEHAGTSGQMAKKSDKKLKAKLHVSVHL